MPGGDIEFIQVNITDPWNEVDGERGSVKSKHFAFSDPKVREAMALLCDKKSMQDFIYGRTGVATGNFMNNPERFRSKNTKWEFNVDKANQILDAAGWKRGADGIREKGGKKMKFVYQTSINPTRQKEQAIVKQAAQKAGIDLELKSVTASVFFSSDVANPDTYQKFWADMQMYTTTMTAPDAERFMDQYKSEEISQKANKWSGRNICRYVNPEYDKLAAAGVVRARPGQARRDLHQDERHGGQRVHRHPADQPAARARRQPQAGDRRCRAGTSTSRRCTTGTEKAAPA